MNLAIDCRMSGKSGIGAFLDNMLPTFIEEIAANGGCVLLIGLPQKKSEELQATKLSGLENCEFIPCTIKPFSVKEMLFFPRAVFKKINSCDAYFSPYCNIPGNIATGITVPVFATIHDVIFLDMPDIAGRFGTFLRKIIYKRAIRKSSAIFTVSQFSKSRIQEKLNCKKNIFIAHNGVPIFHETSSVGKAEKTNTIIFVGNIKKHKGLATLIPAFISAFGTVGSRSRQGKAIEQTSTDSKITTDRGAPQLLIVGSKENFRTQDTALENLISTVEKNGIVFTGFVPDHELKTLIAQARLLVQPSLYEGFGIPPLQALYSGTKAVISDIPVFKEIYANLPVTFFRAGDADDLAEKLREIYFDNSPLAEFERIYSYEKSARDVLKAIQTCIEK